jgi:hypothetical protein
MHMYADIVSIVGSGFVTSIFHWIGGRSTFFTKATFDQILWVSGCVYWITTGVTTVSSNFIGYIVVPNGL